MPCSSPSSISLLQSPLLLRWKSATSSAFPSPKLPSAKLRNYFSAVSCIPPRHLDQQEILRYVAESNDRILPCVRTFENDLARLSLVGSVAFEQALTAAAADGGRAAAEHIKSGEPAMVVETVFPGPADEHATVSTRLFLPADKVRAKARKMKASLEDILSGTNTKNILALTFRQVVLQQLWNFELVMFEPGIERDMKDLETPREQVAAFFAISSSDDRVISVLAEAIANAALQSTERSFLEGFEGITSNRFFSRYRERKRIASKDSSVVIYQVQEDEISGTVETLLESFKLSKGKFSGMKRNQGYKWWTPSAESKLESRGGAEFSAWTSEFVAIYQLLVDGDKVGDVKFEGWTKLPDNKFEVLLTHSQMVCLAEILDIYYEDAYSLPKKELSCGSLANVANLSEIKRKSTLMKTLSLVFASGVCLITLVALGQFDLSFLRRGQKHAQQPRSLLTSETEYLTNESVDPEQLNKLCVSVIKRMKDAYDWPEDIQTDLNLGAWIGEIPNYLKMREITEPKSKALSTGLESMQDIDEKVKSSVQDIASYQVVMSRDGKLVEFQPTSEVGLNQWAANPLANELYGVEKPSPNIIEPQLKTKQLPDEAVVIELLMSVKDAHFALARPFQWHTREKNVKV
ncbi:hypothetical protein LINPERHAP1_LOCUS25943 [Linum perenne]